MDVTPKRNALDIAEIMRRFERPLLQYATRIIGDRERARDVVQETFVQLQQASQREQDDAPAKWLFTVCRNRALNVCRRERRLLYLGEDSFAEQSGEEAWPNEQLEKKEARSFLLRTLRRSRYASRKCCN